MGVVLLALGWESFVLSIQYNLLLPHAFALTVIGGALILIGVAIRVLAFAEIPNTYRIEGLVTTGIYAKTRNPIYLSFMVIFAGLAVASTALLALVWASACIVVLYWVAAKEETELERVFGDRYILYKKAVPMFFPQFRKPRALEQC